MSTYGLRLLHGNKAEGCHGDIRINTKDITLHTHTINIRASTAVDVGTAWVHIPSWNCGKPSRPLWTNPYVLAHWKSGTVQHHRWRCSALPPVCRPWPTPWRQTLSALRRREIGQECKECNTFSHLHQTQMHPQWKEKLPVMMVMVDWYVFTSEGLTTCYFVDQDKQQKNHHADDTSAVSGNLH